MLRITQSQLKQKLTVNSDFKHFFLIGADHYLQDVSLQTITTYLKSKFEIEKHQFTLNTDCDFDQITHLAQSFSLFSDKKLIVLHLGDNAINAELTKKIQLLSELINEDLYVVFSAVKITKTQESTTWFKRFSNNALFVHCQTPDNTQLPSWINRQLQQLKISLEPKAIDLLCYYYEGNLLSLAQILEQLSLLYPSHHISYEQVKNSVFDAAIFTPFHWIDALILRKVKRSIHILKQLEISGTEPLILLRIFQRELIQIINIKKISQKDELKSAYDHYKIWQSKRNILTPYILNTDFRLLKKSLEKLTEIEIALKTNQPILIWNELENLTLIFVNKH